MNQDQFFWLLLSFILTIMVLSYILGDNPLFRIATYLFIGVASAYVFVLIFYQVLIPKLIMPLFTGDINQRIIQIIPITLSALLFFKLSKRTSSVGNISLAFLVGSGAAIIITSAFSGTLLPMIDIITEPFTLNSLNFQKLIGGIILLLGAISSLLYFQFSTIEASDNLSIFSRFMQYSKKVGTIFIGITLGSIFAGVIISSVLALIERLNFIITFIFSLMSG
ncbi:MAG: hypothetical protein IH585_10695 [Anaerolineaceae bacterium]|nr:hypothetical protein [Anaerolineaceae bacterium]